MPRRIIRLRDGSLEADEKVELRTHGQLIK